MKIKDAVNKENSCMKKRTIWAARIFFALIFIFSGFVKAVDPLGSVYKFQDFMVVFNVEWLFAAALPLAVLLSTLEFVVGLAFLFGWRMRLFAPVGLVLMALFTPATIYIALTNPVPHCGCFGDAIVISNEATAFKNGLLLAAAAVVFFNRNNMRPLFSAKNDKWFIAGAALFISALSVYGLLYLPVIDFRPWKTGSNIAGLIALPKDASGTTYLLFENRVTGEMQTYPADDYPWDDPEWAGMWEYTARQEKPNNPEAVSPLANFNIIDESGNDVTGSVINHPGYLYLIVAYDLNRTNRRAFTLDLPPLVQKIQENGHAIMVLTASLTETAEIFKEKHTLDYPFYFSDERELKTIIRSNPGLVLIKDGVVLGKWPHRSIPSSVHK
jgi:uncharacterized membrane protein YphA (DoxX/SURF4 family)